MKSTPWTEHVCDLEVKLTKNDLLRLLLNIYSDDDKAEIIIELLDTNTRVLESIKKWINKE